MENKKLDFYTNIGFLICIFIFTFSFFNDSILQEATLVSSALSGLLGIIVAGGLLLLVQKQSLYIKIGVLLCVILIVGIASNYCNPSIQGNWIVKEKNRSCKLLIGEKDAVMTYSTENTSRTYEYEREKELLTLYNDTELIMIEWRILKVTKDSLIVQELNTIIEDTESNIHRFVKE